MRLSGRKVSLGLLMGNLRPFPKGLARLTSRSEEGGGWVGELLASGQGPIGPRKAGQEVVPKVKLVGVALHGTGRGAVNEEPGLVLLCSSTPRPLQGLAGTKMGLRCLASASSEPSLTSPLVS